MKVYNKGIYIPMDQVTWDMMCSPETRVTNEAPLIWFPLAVRRAAITAPNRIAKYFGRKLEELTK